MTDDGIEHPNDSNAAGDNYQEVDRDQIEDPFLLQTEAMLRIFATAYLLEIAGMLDASLRNKLDRISKESDTSWETEVEEQHGLPRLFLSNLYAALLEHFSPHQAIAFILRGLGFSHPERLLDELVESDSTPEANPSSASSPPHFASSFLKSIHK